MRCCALLAAFLAAATRVAGHPICTDDTPPVAGPILDFCETQPEGVCCTDLDEDALEAILQGAGALSPACEGYHKQVICGRCHSYSGHLYARLWPPAPLIDGLTMKKDFCNEYVAACTGYIAFPDYDDGLTYCEKHAGTQQGDIFWSYPYTPVIPPDGDFIKAFPDLALADQPGQTLAVKQSPDGSMFWIVGQLGEIMSVDAGNTGSTTTTVINLGPHEAPSLDPAPGGKFHVNDEEGLIDVAFDPNFDNGSGAFYLSYTVKLNGDNRPRNRLSKFQYYEGDPIMTRLSEEFLLTTITKISPIHSAGWVDFKPSDFANPGPAGSSHDIYWSIGDGGKKTDQQNRGQDPTNLLGSIVRITVSGTGTGYTIPAGNIDGGGDPLIKEEICAYGFRNPYKCSFDTGDNDKLYCGDVGHARVEEIDLIECGQNYGWRLMEGNRCQSEIESTCPDYGSAASRAEFTFPYYQYCHPEFDSTDPNEQVNTAGFDLCGDRQITGHCIIGGYVYRGELFADLLYGAYIFGDNVTKNLHYLIEADDGTITVGNIISDGSMEVIGFAQTVNGELMVIDEDYDIWELPCGDLCRPTCLDKSETVPSIESEGCFVQVASDPALPVQSPSCPSGQDAMSAELCASYCGTVPGMEYMGLHAGSECWCGGSGVNFGRHGSATTCDMPCNATPEENCGGVDAIEVFSLGPPEATPAPTPFGTPAPTTTPSGTPVPTTTPSGTPVPTTTPSGTPVPTTTPSGTPVPTTTPSGTPVPTTTPSGTPVPTTTPSGTPVPTTTPSGTPVPTTTPSGTPVPTTTPSGTPVPTTTPSGTPVPTTTPSGTPVPTTTPSGTPVPTTTPSGTPVPTTTPSGTPVPTPTPFATPVPVVLTPFTYIECFKDLKADRIMTVGSKSNTMNAQKCYARCIDSPFFATQYGRECWCGSDADYDRHGLSTGCTVDCPGTPGDEICGGSYAASVYRNNDVDPSTPAPGATPSPVQPPNFTSLGCFQDVKSDRIMSKGPKSDNMDAEFCAAECPDSPFFATQYGRECWCGSSDDYDKHGPSTGCTFECTGDSAEVCGGFYAASVYSNDNVPSVRL